MVTDAVEENPEIRARHLQNCTELLGRAPLDFAQDKGHALLRRHGVKTLREPLADFSIVDLSLDGPWRVHPTPGGIEPLFNRPIDISHLFVPPRLPAGLGNLLIEDPEQPGAHVGPALKCFGPLKEGRKGRLRHILGACGRQPRAARSTCGR